MEDKYSRILNRKIEDIIGDMEYTSNSSQREIWYVEFLL